MGRHGRDSDSLPRGPQRPEEEIREAAVLAMEMLEGPSVIPDLERVASWTPPRTSGRLPLKRSHISRNEEGRSSILPTGTFAA